MRTSRGLRLPRRARERRRERRRASSRSSGTDWRRRSDRGGGSTPSTRLRAPGRTTRSPSRFASRARSSTWSARSFRRSGAAGRLRGGESRANCPRRGRRRPRRRRTPPRRAPRLAPRPGTTPARPPRTPTVIRSGAGRRPRPPTLRRPIAILSGIPSGNKPTAQTRRLRSTPRLCRRSETPSPGPRPRPRRSRSTRRRLQSPRAPTPRRGNAPSTTRSRATTSFTPSDTKPRWLSTPRASRWTLATTRFARFYTRTAPRRFRPCDNTARPSWTAVPPTSWIPSTSEHCSEGLTRTCRWGIGPTRLTIWRL
mmetsp:Transcript_2093/g.8139  ORF Transcript_2093/g.8139 Transcript_2093/m.8139 type:complete len:311 (+) Transcript_2093:532-1464(+)